MRELSLIIIFLITFFVRNSDSPHGNDLDISCSECHTSEGWKVDIKNISFNHDITNFELTGVHEQTDCKNCHPTLVFNEAPIECAGCHTDMHNQSVSSDCGSCHTTNSWLVNNIIQIHRKGRFPLVGAHLTADCYECHISASTLDFTPLGINCYDCHFTDYNSAKDPDHVASGFSINCIECHEVNAFSWSGAGINHSFFPLTQGHDINNCAECHTTGSFSGLSPQCITCHESDYQEAAIPNHTELGFSTECTECHTTNPGWKPAEFRNHDVLFPIYSGEHNGEWSDCMDCHPNTSNYSEFTCISCHEHNQGDMDEEHNGISGYVYSSTACLACHPTGSEDGAFNHNSTNFPLTGAHITTQCAECHTEGYAGTPMDCASCHTNDFTGTTNPGHLSLGLSTNCSLCHTTEPGWAPASFDIHNEYYQLNGAHQLIANNCFECHEGNYNQTPNTCFGCHADDYNSTTDPNHLSAQFGTDCLFCHNESAWEPSTFDHDNQYFPIYSGKHRGEWSSCTDCHTIPGDFSSFSCIDCHEHNQSEMDDEHSGVSGYAYNSLACLSCHPDGSEKTMFRRINNIYK